MEEKNDEKWLSLHIENKEKKIEKEHRSLIG